MHNKSKIVRFFGLGMLMQILLITCKMEVKKLEFDTQIEALVVNENNQPLTGVTIGLYSDLETYRTDIQNLTTNNALQDTLTDGSGLATFKNLKEDASYWLAVYFDDTLKFPGRKLLYNNKNINNSLAIKPRKGSINYVTLKLEAFEGLLTFTADTSDNRHLPLEVTVNQTAAGQITRTKTGPASAFNDPDGLTTPVSKGTYTYYVRSADCIWQGTGTLAGATWQPVHLAPCNAGDFVFYTTDTTSAIFPITIVLNDTDVLPNITNANPALPPCNTSRTPGIYNYKAETANKSCSWTGTLNVQANQCIRIQLPKCN